MSTPQVLAIYCRLSRAIGGQTETVERQERWGRDYAGDAVAAGRWPDLPIRVYCDNDKSAWKDDVDRPDYDRLRDDIRAGTVARVWAVEQTRIEANRLRWVELAVTLVEAGIECIDTNRDGQVRIDEVADIKNVLAWHERSRLAKRVNDTLGDLAAEGRPDGASSWGYRHVREEDRARRQLVQSEADEARMWAERVLSGWNPEAIARDLTARKVPTRRGGTWRGPTVVSILTSPTIAGKRVHRGEVIGDGDWEPVLDEVTWRRLLERFDTSGAPPKHPARSYLLSGGLAVCGRCGHRLAGKRRKGKRANPIPSYVCAGGRSGGCEGISVRADSLEEHVCDTFLAWLDSTEFRARLAAGDPHADRRSQLTLSLGDLDRRRRQTAARWAKGELEADEWDEARRTFKAEKARLGADLAAVPDPVTDVDSDAVLAAWGDMVVDERRHVMCLFLDRVEIHPTRRRGPGLDTGRVKVYDLDGNPVA